MDPRVSPPKPHRGLRQQQRRSQRRYIPRELGQQVRYIPPPDLRQPIYSQDGMREYPYSYSHRSEDFSGSNKQEQQEREFTLPQTGYNLQPTQKSMTDHYVQNTYSDDSHYVSVSLDYVPDRGYMLWSRWILILLCLGQLSSAFAVVGCHAADFSEDTKLEVGLSLGLLIFGNIFATGIVTATLFYRRWRNEEVRARSKGVEANHEAWICTKAALSLIGMATIARYIELFAVYRRLSQIERRFKKEQASTVNSTSFQNHESLSRSPLQSANMSEEVREREQLNRLRRLFVQLDFDACVVGLANATLGAGPFAVAQGVLYLRRLMLNRMMPNSTGGAILAAFIFALLWLTAAACQFQPDAHYLSPSEVLQKPAHKHLHLISTSGRIMLFFARAFHISIRMITFTLFAGLFNWILVVVVAIHGLFCLLMLIIYRGSRGSLSTMYKANPTYRRPLDRRLKSKGILRHLWADLLYSYANIYDFFNGSAGKTRLRSILYYFAYYLENSIMIGVWYANYPYTAAWYHLPALLVVVTVQWLGAIFLQLYLFYCSSSPRGTSLCGMCCPEELRGHTEQVYSLNPSGDPSTQTAHPLPPPPIDNPSFILQPTSLYSHRSYGQRSLDTPLPAPSGTDSLTVVTTEIPKKPRSKYLHVRDPVDDRNDVEWQGVEGTVFGEGSDV
ncbi:hypothetical protein Aperf_G00000119670 [Anoplocephala perfoliata]